MRSSIIDIIKGISIIMIVNVHLLSGNCFAIGCTFHVIAFFFTAGLVHAMKSKWNSISFRSFTSAQLKRLGYPFLTLHVCYLVVHIAVNLFRGESLLNETIITVTLKAMSLQGVGTLWFLPVLFFGECFFFFFKRRKINDIVPLILGVLSVFVSSYLNSKGFKQLQDYCGFNFLFIVVKNIIVLSLSSIVASSIIALGSHLLMKYPSLFAEKKHISNRLFFIVCIICIISLIVNYTLIRAYRGDLHKLDIGNPFIYIICSMAGLSFVTSLAYIINNRIKALSRLLIYYGRNSLIVMTTHTEYHLNTIVHIFVTTGLIRIGLSLGSECISCLSLILIMILEVGVIFLVKCSWLQYLYNYELLKGTLSQKRQ